MSDGSGQQNDYGWLTELLSMVASQSPVQGISSLPSGLRASGINATAGPEVLYAAGMFDSDRISALVRDEYNRLTADYQSSLADIYGDLPLPPAETYSYQFDPYFNSRPEIKEIFDYSILPGIANGKLSTEADIDSYLGGLLKDGNYPQEFKNILAVEEEKIKDLIKTTNSEFASNAEKLAEYQSRYGAAKMAADAKAEALGAAPPTEQQAYANVVKGLGAPQLAGLPSPTERFELPLKNFLDTEKLGDLQSEFSIARSKLESPRMERLQRAQTQQDLMAQRWQGRANQELARQFAERETEPKQRGFLETFGSKVAGAVSALPSGGLRGVSAMGNEASDLLATIFTGTSPKQERAKSARQKAMEGIAAQEFARLQGAGPAPAPMGRMPARTGQQQLEDALLKELGFDVSKPDERTLRLIRGGNREARLLRRQQVGAQRRARAAVQKALRDRARAQDFLAQAGITPASQAQAQLLLNAALQAAK